MDNYFTTTTQHISTMDLTEERGLYVVDVIILLFTSPLLVTVLYNSYNTDEMLFLLLYLVFNIRLVPLWTPIVIMFTTAPTVWLKSRTSSRRRKKEVGLSTAGAVGTVQVKK